MKQETFVGIMSLFQMFIVALAYFTNENASVAVFWAITFLGLNGLNLVVCERLLSLYRKKLK